MEIIKKNITDLKEYKNNVKVHHDEQVELIAESIEKYGFNDPIVINEDNVIIEGHGRYLACKRLEKKEVDCVVLNHMSKEEVKEYRLLHNHLNMMTPFDLKALEIELVDIDLSDFDLEPLNIDWDTLEETVDYEQMKNYQNTLKSNQEEQLDDNQEEQLDDNQEEQLEKGLVICPHCNKSFKLE